MSIENLVIILFLCWLGWKFQRNVSKAGDSGLAKAAKWGFSRWLK